MLGKFWGAVVASAVSACFLLNTGWAEESRVALVIGNASYWKAGELKTAINDAKKMSAALQRLHFKVIEGTNFDHGELTRSLTDLAQLTKSEKVEIGLIYYAGHGLTVDGRSYLVPVEVRADHDPLDKMVPIDDLINALDGVSQLKIIILDACRNTEFREIKGVGNRSLNFRAGLGHISESPADGGKYLIAFATGENKVAYDGVGDNSPYTSALLSLIEHPGLRVNELFEKVRDQVDEQSRREGPRQTPNIVSSVGSEPIFLAPTAAAQDEIAYWNGAKKEDTVDMYRQYLDRYPSGFFAKAALDRITQLLSQVPPSGSCSSINHVLKLNGC